MRVILKQSIRYPYTVFS